MSTTKRLALTLIVATMFGAAACADSTAPVEPKPNLEQGGTPPNCWPGYHTESQGSGGYACVPNG